MAACASPGVLAVLPGWAFWDGDGCFVCRWCHYLSYYKMFHVRPFFFFFFSCFHVLPSLLPVWLAEILKFVLIISPPQQNPSIEKSPIRIPQELQLWRPFHTAQWDRNKAYVLQSGYTNYSLPVTRKRERRQRRHQRQNALSFLSLSHCASQACLPDGEERFVKRITVERVKPFQAPGKIEGDICM